MSDFVIIEILFKYKRERAQIPVANNRNLLILLIVSTNLNWCLLIK